MARALHTLHGMAQHKLRSRIAQFKEPFLVGAVTSAALLSGCGGATKESGVNPGELTGEGEQSGPEPQVTSNPPVFIQECPTVWPDYGARCDGYQPELTCDYGGTSGCQRSFRCVDGTWADRSPSCNPPPPDVSGYCPMQVPSHGGDCSAYADSLACHYDSNSNCAREFSCTEGTWHDVSPTCNPPSPQLSSECPPDKPNSGDSCGGYESGLDCKYDVDLSCWLEFRCDAGEWVDNSPSCNPPPPQWSDECPAQKPPVDADCSAFEPGLRCEYETDTSCPSSVTCIDYAWENTTMICNPPPPIAECPTETPAAGDDCQAYQVGLECGEATCDGGVAAYCGSSGKWETFALACNPPDWGPDPEPGDGGVDSGR